MLVYGVIESRAVRVLCSSASPSIYPRTEVSLAGTEAGHLSVNSITAPGHPYVFLYG